MKKICSVAILLALIGCSKAENAVPDFVRPVAKRGADDKLVSLANAVVIDNVNGFLVTNAHFVEGASGVDVRLPAGWIKAEFKEEWIDWDADLALLKIKDSPYWASLISIKEAELTTVIPDVHSSVQIRGYLPEYRKLPNTWKFNKIWTNGVLKKQQSSWCINIPSCQYVLTVLNIQLASGTLPKELQRYLYEAYILVSQKGHSSMAIVEPGLSGSPVLNSDNLVAGFVSGGSKYYALAIPARKIKNLLQKAKNG